MNLIIVIILIVIAYLFLTNDKQIEGIGTGALIQLYAKGPQDTYLSGDAAKYWPYWGPYYYYGWRPFWQPTRFGRMNYNYYRPYALRY